MVDLRLYDPATKTWAAEKAGEPWFEKLAKSVDADGNGLDERELLDLVKRINPEGAAVERTFRGRIELRNNVEAHRLAEKGAAIRACDSCHSAGSEPFRNVTVSVNGPDGRPMRHAAQPAILGAATAVMSLPEFYAIGGTRSRLLDVLFVLALLGGAGFPIGHLTVRWLFTQDARATERCLTCTKIYVHPLPVRIWHWTNALGFVALILTGVQIRYVGPDRRDVVQDGGRRCTTGSASC